MSEPISEVPQPQPTPERDPTIEANLASIRPNVPPEVYEEMYRNAFERLNRERTRAGDKPRESFSDALQRYANEKEQGVPPVFPLEASFKASVRDLLYKQEEGKFVPGRLLNNPEVLEQLTGGVVTAEFLQRNPMTGLRNLEDVLTNFVKVDMTGGQQVIMIRPDDDAGRFEWSSEVEETSERGLPTPGYVEQISDDIHITPESGATLQLTFVPRGLATVEAAMLDKNGMPTGQQVISDPVLRAVVTEGEKKTRISRRKDSVIVAPGDGKAVCYPNESKQVYR
jgi:hypothetical protein